MPEVKEMYKHWMKLVFLISIILTVVFLAIFFIIGLRIQNEDACGIDKFGARHNEALQNHSHVLDNAVDFVIQPFDLNTSHYLRYEFCYYIYCDSSDGAEINVINEEDTVLKTDYVIKGTTRVCGAIQNITGHQYLGLNCPTCVNPVNGCIIQETIIGEEFNHVENDASSITVEFLPSMAYTLNAYKDCKGLLKFFVWLYVVLIGGLFFILFILLGFTRLERLLFEDFPK